MEPDPDYQALHEADAHFCEQLTSLVEIIGTLPLTGTIESFYRLALHLARERLGFETVALRFRPAGRTRLSREAREFLVSGGETGGCGEKGHSPAARRRTRWSESSTTAVVPIFDAETPIGQIRIENRQSGKPLTRQQRELLRLFALALGCLHTRKRIEAEREKTIEDLQAAIARINTLHGLLPICCSCKKIRQDDGYWSQIEEYLQAHSDATFSHGICPECARKLYPEVYERQCRKKELRVSAVEEKPVSVGEPVVGASGENPEDSPETTGNG
ncbi:MAG TPA: hypothetical protein PLA90_06640 [Candidatus Sumerlaeota bacterium]|nr:hypothetical protein [Candidatus Sumerlaeota bacterium]HPS01202.1 hypothetical protein [Candidatus Sumerlaeota bacterium]